MLFRAAASVASRLGPRLLMRSALGCSVFALAIPPSPRAHSLCSAAGPPSVAPDISSTAPPQPGALKLALCQINVGLDKAENLAVAASAVREAASEGAQLVCLPECFNSPYDSKQFPAYAEDIPTSAANLDPEAHPSTAMLCKLASELGIFLIGGSFPERDATTGQVFNTCVVVGPDGELLCKHRKMHLFDIDVPGKITFKESDTLSAGNTLSLFDTPWGRIGVGICYDIRFPQLAMLLREAGAHMLCYPGAFNLTTGPLHWELLARARAVDNQCFVVAPSPARNPEAGYQAWGHSSVISPWGDVVATTGHEPTTVYAEVDLAKVEPTREGIPVSRQKRDDLYSVTWRH